MRIESARYKIYFEYFIIMKTQLEATLSPPTYFFLLKKSPIIAINEAAVKIRSTVVDITDPFSDLL